MSLPRKTILGISAFYHDSAATLIVDGEIVAAAQEERFTRIKHDMRFPVNAVKYVLSEYGITVDELDMVVFYEKPYIKFERIIETYLFFAPRGLKSFLSAMPVWFHEKFFPRREIWNGLKEVHGGTIQHAPELIFSEHHLSHAASAFYPSPFETAAIVTIDGVGEWATATIAYGDKTRITMLREMNFPHSIGLLYSAFTYYCGFRVNSGEYKLMGLAPYGNRGSDQVERFKKKIVTELISIHGDGSISLDMAYFDFATGLTMCNDKKWEQLFGIPRRPGESEITQAYMDMALAIQEVTEEIVMRIVSTAKQITHASNLVLAGGVALNCVANSKILAGGIFDNVWVQPAAGDAGGALGAAYIGAFLFGESNRKVHSQDSMRGSYLGPAFSDEEAIRVAHKYGAPFRVYSSEEEFYTETAGLLAGGHVVGWFQGRMEWGPRALGNRSILGDPRDVHMQKKLNLKIKFREGFRPFAPSVLVEDMEEYFDWSIPSPYMLFVAPVKKELRKPYKADGGLYERLYSPRSDLPAITHMDYSARLQTVDKNDNEKYWKLINAFKQITGYGVVINTSFNVRGEPIVCTPLDAYKCFMSSDMDYVVIGNVCFSKKDQPETLRSQFTQQAHALD